ncbi:MAG: hypothetical protein II360_00415 [Muribaculaceae bacterium]|nr:hypothetical protein [Muribaculaceae bacterium]
MKKLIFVLIAVGFALCSMAQEHLSFKGIPITGTMTSFCQQLKAKGFTQIGRENNITLFSGDFTGRTATVGVVAADDGKNVFGVTVLFDSSGEWNTLVNTYEYYKELYTRKYGKPDISKEKNSAYGDDNISKMAEVHQGTVVWGSAWETKGGDIEISIEKSGGFYEGVVVIRYRDTLNVEAKIQSDMEDI